ncbi:MAG TPA: YigZ family protein [Xanthomonadales bacterium]|nr:YigZ family protein [Xanthomonadales bacterium]
MKTLASPCRYEELIRKSRFVAHAAPVSSQAETLAFYESVADPGATHNCWAWRIDHVYRFNDDGEPGGSAGRPILAAIEGRELQRVMVVVTRWFGGIKLGVGGLIRAYGGCAAKCLDRAEITELLPQLECTLQADFSLASAVHQLLQQFDAEKLDERFESRGMQLKIRVARSRYEALSAALADASSGAAHLSITDRNPPPAALPTQG